jgi:hypothetical protein
MQGRCPDRGRRSARSACDARRRRVSPRRPGSGDVACMACKSMREPCITCTKRAARATDGGRSSGRSIGPAANQPTPIDPAANPAGPREAPSSRPARGGKVGAVWQASSQEGTREKGRCYRSTIELASGRAPAPSSSSVRRAGAGNLSWRGSPADRMSRRLCSLLRSSRMTRGMSPSRCFRAIRRSSACRSWGRVSASTPESHPRPVIIASHARRSPGIGSGTSWRHPKPGCSRARRRWSSSTWARSRIGSPAG